MTSISQPIVFFGTEDFSLLTLQRLVEAGFPVVGVVTKPDSKKGRGHALSAPAVKTYAVAHNIPVWQPAKLIEITDIITQLGSPVGVLVSYGKIIPQSIIDLFTPGIINVHPSLLPRYRGPSPIESAIKNGDDVTGVSIMQLSAAMDAGPVYTQVTVPLSGIETRPQLYNQLGTLGAQLLTDSLPTIVSGELVATPQDDSQATYCQLLTKHDAWLHPEADDAKTCERLIRAHLGFPKSKLILLNQECIITKASVSPQKQTPLDVLCRDGAYLSIEEVVAPSGKTMSATAFINGYAA